MPSLRFFRVTPRGTRVEQSLDELFAEKLVEEMRAGRESPIVRNNLDMSPVPHTARAAAAKRGQQYKEVEKYLSRIAVIMAEMGQDGGDVPNSLDERGAEETITDDFSQSHILNVSSSYLSRAIGGQEDEDDNQNTGRDDNNDQACTQDKKCDDDAHDLAFPRSKKPTQIEIDQTSELLRMVRDKLKAYQSAAESEIQLDDESVKDEEGSEKESVVLSNESAIEEIIEALSRVKTVISTPKGDDAQSTCSMKSTKSTKSTKSSLSHKLGLLKLLGVNKAKPRGNDARDGQSPRQPRLKYTFRTARSPKTAQIKSAGSSVAKPPLPSTNRNELSPKVPQSPFKLATPKGTAASPRKPIVPKVDPPQMQNASSKPSLIPTDLHKSTVVPLKSPCKILSLSISIDGHDGRTSTTRDFETQSPLMFAPLSPEAMDSSVEVQPTPRSEVLPSETPRESTNHLGANEAEDIVAQPGKMPKKRVSVDDILKMTDESTTETNRDLTPRHMPRNSPAWLIANAQVRRNKKLRFRAFKRKSANTTRSAASCSPLASSPLVSPIAGTTTSFTTLDPQSAEIEVGSVFSMMNTKTMAKTEETLSEMEAHIKDAETIGALGDDEQTRTGPHPGAKPFVPVRSATSARVDALLPMLPSGDSCLETSTLHTTETPSVACSRTTVPVANTSPDWVSPRRRPAPIIEFSGEQLKSGSFSSSESESTDDTDGNDTDDNNDTDDDDTGDDTDDDEEDQTDTLSNDFFGDPSGKSKFDTLEMSFSLPSDMRRSGGTEDYDLEDEPLLDDIRSISEFSTAVLEEAKELKVDMKQWLCFL